MASGPVVERFNIIEDIRLGQIPAFVYSLPDAFFFQRTEERFGHRIIPAVATPTHTGGLVLPGRSAASRHCRTGYPGRPSKSQAVIGMLLTCLFWFRSNV